MTIPETRYELNTSLVDNDSGAIPLTASSAANLLSSIVQNCSGQLVVFDLDSTLLNNHNRSAQIMREYANAFGYAHLASADASHWVDWSARNAMANTGMSDTDIDSHISDFEQFWSERFFLSDYCQYDTAIAGAEFFVNQLHKTGATVTYLTGRAENTREGTLLSLDSLHFPTPKPSNDVTLIMRPETYTSDDLFKHDAISRLKDASIIAAFDNEPSHINTYCKLLPDAISVHLFTDHSGRAVKLLHGIVSIQHFSALSDGDSH